MNSTLLNYPSTQSFASKIAERFSKASLLYEENALIQREIGHDLLSKLPVDLPELIVDLGCGTGYFARELKSLFPESSVILLDNAFKMLEQASLKNKANLVCATMESLPLLDQSIDLIFANMSLQWSSDLKHNFDEIHRVLKPAGHCLLSVPSPLTLKELKQSWQRVDQGNHVNEFCSQLELEQAVQESGLQLLEINTKQYTLEYPSVYELMRHLKITGTDYVLQAKKTLTGKDKFNKMLAAYEDYRQANGMLPCTYEIISLMVAKPHA